MNALYAKEKDDGRDVAEDARRQVAPHYAMLAGAIDGDESLKALTAPREGRQALPVTAGLRRPVWHRSLGFDAKAISPSPCASTMTACAGPRI